jgi:hypothetical protein
LRVDIRADGVVLQGFARTWYAKQLAQHAPDSDARATPILRGAGD